MQWQLAVLSLGSTVCWRGPRAMLAVALLRQGDLCLFYFSLKKVVE
jgi:hypothetical protein